MQHFDLLFIVSGFQRSSILLPAISLLSQKYSIGYFVITSDKTTTRTSLSLSKFCDICDMLGAEQLYFDSNYHCNLLLLPQSDYDPGDVRCIQSSITSRFTYLLSGVAMGNSFLQNLRSIKVDRILVPDKNLYNYRVHNFPSDSPLFSDDKIIEIGMPHTKYSLSFLQLNVDYIIATPTPFSFTSAFDRYAYLSRLYSHANSLFSQGYSIAYKPHNADERFDYIVNRHITKLVRFFPFRTISTLLLSKLYRLFSRFSNSSFSFFHELLCSLFYLETMKLVTPLDKLTQYSTLNLELFLPFVRRGLITGRSNSIWQALYAKLPVWNLIPENSPYFSTTKMHMYTMKYLSVHYNDSDPDYFDSKSFSIIEESTRRADFVQLLTSTLSSFSTND